MKSQAPADGIQILISAQKKLFDWMLMAPLAAVVNASATPGGSEPAAPLPEPARGQKRSGPGTRSSCSATRALGRDDAKVLRGRLSRDLERAAEILSGKEPAMVGELMNMKSRQFVAVQYSG